MKSSATLSLSIRSRGAWACLWLLLVLAAGLIGAPVVLAQPGDARRMDPEERQRLRQELRQQWQQQRQQAGAGGLSREQRLERQDQIREGKLEPKWVNKKEALRTPPTTESSIPAPQSVPNEVRAPVPTPMSSETQRAASGQMPAAAALPPERDRARLAPEERRELRRQLREQYQANQAGQQ